METGEMASQITVATEVGTTRIVTGAIGEVDTKEEVTGATTSEETGMVETEEKADMVSTECEHRLVCMSIRLLCVACMGRGHSCIPE